MAAQHWMVFAIVAAAALYVGRTLYRSVRGVVQGRRCEDGCGECGCGGGPARSGAAGTSAPAGKVIPLNSVRPLKDADTDLMPMPSSLEQRGSTSSREEK